MTPPMEKPPRSIRPLSGRGRRAAAQPAASPSTPPADDYRDRETVTPGTGGMKELIDLQIRTLVLVRHARSGDPAGVRDHDRPLTDAGRAAAVAAGDWWRSQWEPLDVLSSIALRAQQTARAAAATTPIRSAAQLDEADPQDVPAVLRTTTDSVRTLLFVGHLPGVPALADQLTTTDSTAPAAELAADFPTATPTVLQFSGRWAELDSGGARLAFARRPAGGPR